MMEHINCIFQFYKKDKSADLILFNISDEEFINAYRWIHIHHAEDEFLLTKIFDEIEGEFSLFSINCNNYVFMRLFIPSDSKVSDDKQIKEVNVMNLAYNVLWDVDENWKVGDKE